MSLKKKKKKTTTTAARKTATPKKPPAAKKKTATAGRPPAATRTATAKKKTATPIKQTATAKKATQKRPVSAIASDPAGALQGLLFDFAMTLPGAYEDHPWGELVVKVDKKIFVFLGRAASEDGTFDFSVKLPDSGEQALRRPYGAPTAYGLGRSGWVTLDFAIATGPSTDEMIAWIEESYRSIATKRRVKELEARA